MAFLVGISRAYYQGMGDYAAWLAIRNGDWRMEEIWRYDTDAERARYIAEHPRTVQSVAVESDDLDFAML